MSAAVQVFTRSPALGTVKTRLAASLGDASALALHLAMGRRSVRALTVPPRAWTAEVCVTPDDGRSLDAVRRWLPEAHRVSPQGAGDLGTRMGRSALRAFAEGYSRVVLVGTDCLAVDSPSVTEALRALDSHDAVLGPALDGGYWLLGLSRFVPIFDGVPWGSATVAETTRSLLRAHGASWAELPIARDLDTLADLSAHGGLEALLAYCETAPPRTL